MKQRSQGTRRVDRKSRIGGRRLEDGGKQMISHPPQIEGYQIRHGVRMRFTANAAVATNITYQNLLDLWLVATSATAVSDLFGAVKVRGVEVWALPVIGNATTVQVVFDGLAAASVGDQMVHTDTSMGVQPAHVKCKPTARSLAANWQLSSSNSAFELVVPSGAVIDVEVSFKQVSGLNPAAQNVGAALTAGFVYNRGLDGLAVASTKLPGAIGSV